MAEASGIRSAITVALHKDDALLGIITVYRQEVRPFTDKQIALLQNFAAQAVIAMENARLITETREALEQQTATAEVLQVINSSPGDLTPVFDAMLEKALHLCEASFGMLHTQEGDTAQIVASRNFSQDLARFMAHMPQPQPQEAQIQILEGAPFVHVHDLKDSDAYRSGTALRRAAVDLGGLRTGLAVPLLKDGRVLGN
jgi:GAF domain-containing protein